MVQIPDAVKQAIEKQDVYCVATCDDKFTPNVVYIKFLKVVDDQTILIADNYLNKTRDNVENNGKVSFVVLDDEKGSYQVKGTAQRLTEGPMFDEVQTWCPEKLPREAAVVMKVEEIYNGAKSIA